MPKPRKYLTKSVFKVGLECPRKLYYLNKPEEYMNNKVEDPFLEALARGGFQVGALAQSKFPHGIEVKSKKHEEALKQTEELLKLENVVIFEAAFAFESYFVRADIAIKSGKLLRLIEVKSKSYDPSDVEGEFLSSQAAKKGQLKFLADWSPYFYDMAYQTFVARNNRPDLKVSMSFMALDKTSTCPEEGVHQLFRIQQSGSSKEVVLTKPIPTGFEGHKILKEVDVTEYINQIIEGKELSEFHIGGNLAEKAKKLSDLYLKDLRFPAKDSAGVNCKGCEFRGEDTKLKSGYDECWIEKANIQAASSRKFAFDLWNFRSAHKAFEKSKYLMEQLDESDLGKGTTAPRQALQLNLHKQKAKDPWINKKNLADEMDGWDYPFHFIDFETCAPAIPFKKGFGPYSEVGFQFSHHIMHEDGRVEHIGEFIDLAPGSFPTFHFLRELKKQLENDNGTIFRYSNHENSVINRAIFLLERSNEKDKDELIRFFKTITQKKNPDAKDDFLWKGDRAMVDLLEVVKSHYLSPLMGNSNSLKYVLPAILNESKWLQEKYSRPVYGTPQMPSKNFKNHTWIKCENGIFSSDPYQELDPIFSPEDLKKIESIFSDEEETIKNGGVAMMAYCKSQFTEMTSDERELIKKALLRYCELDTLAMVMLVEYWRDVCGVTKKAA